VPNGSPSSSSNLSVLDQIRIYTTGTFLLPTHSLTHVAPPLDWTDAAKLAINMGVKQVAVPHLPDTKGFSEAQIYDTYAKFVQDHGSKQAQDALTAGKQVIVGLRIQGNSRDNRGRGVYRDRMALIWTETPPTPSPVAGPRVVPTAFPATPVALSPIKHGLDFTANTQPSAQYEDPGEEWKEVTSKKTGKTIRLRVVKKIVGPDGKEVISKPRAKWEGTDVKHEGRKALGELVPGTYKFHTTDKIFVGAKYLTSSNDQAVYRDVNHDGTFTDADIWHTKEGDTVIENGNFGVYIHKGGENNTWSAGCQTLPPDQHKRLFANLSKKQKDYYYVLVTLK